MAYNVQYTANYTNEQSQEVLVSFYQKDSSPVADPPNYMVREMSIVADAESRDPDACIIGRQLELTIWLDQTSTISFETFLTSLGDEWKIIVEVDGTYFFHGFLNPEEGSAPFQDLPYELTLRATDRIGLLKDTPLTDINEDLFIGFYTLIEYIAGALTKTGLDLPIRIYCGYFHSAYFNKGDSLDYDMFNLTKINARRFLKDSNAYVSCYDALKLMLDGGFNVKYHNGYWQIQTLAERQYRPGDNYYVDYDYQGTLVAGAIDTEDYAEVGRNKLIYPCYEDQIQSCVIANKIVTHIFNYNIPEDLVNNQKLQRLGSFLAPLSGSGYSAYNLVGWTHYQGQPQPLADQDPATTNAYIKLEFDAFGTQTDRYYVIEKDPTAPSTVLQNYIRNNNTDFFVDRGDKISISLTFRTKTDESSGPNLTLASMIILKTGASGNSTGDWYSIDESGIWGNTPHRTFAQYNITDDTSEWKTVSFDDLEIPADGTMFLLFGCGEVDTTNEAHFKDLRLSYVPYIRGSRFSMKGDKWVTSDDNKFTDKVEKEVSISDSPKRLVQGGLFADISSVLTLLDPSWYRWPNTSENYHFKELINIGKWNHGYRRFYKIEGSYTSLMYSPQNDPVVRKPLSFDMRYKMTIGGVDRDMVLVAPLEMDILRGIVKANFVEVNDGTDGSDTGNSHLFQYIF